MATGAARRLGLTLGMIVALGLASVLAACANPKTTPLPTSATELSFPDDFSFPPDLSLAPEDSLAPDDSLGPDESIGPDESVPPSGIYTHGKATITFSTGDPTSVVLPHLAADVASTFETDLGVSVSWRGGDWAIHLDAAVPPDPAVLSLFISREDKDPPLSADGSNCTVTFSAETVDHVAGKAECTGLTWNDAFGEMDLPVPTTSPDTTPAGPAFNATITFDATP